MCYTCGCKLPYEDHGDPHNIVEHHFHDAGDTKVIKHAGKKTAKENMLELLEIQKAKNDLSRPKKDYNSKKSSK